jgi:hypothetical protein
LSIRGPLVSLVAPFALAAPGTILAQPAGSAPEPELVALRWEGYGESEGCLGIPSLMVRVEDHLGRRAFDPSSTQVLSVTVSVDGENRFRAVMRVLDASGKVLGERELVTNETTCSALDEPLVLAVALLVDSALGAEPESEPPPPALPPEPPSPEPPEPPERRAPSEVEAPPPPPEPWRAASDLSLIVAEGVLPSLALGAEAGFVLDAPWLFPVRGRVAVFLPQEVELQPAGKLGFWLGLAGMAACPLAVRPEGFAFLGCGGVDLLAQRAVSEGLDGSRSHTEWFAQLSFSLRMELDIRGPWYGVVSSAVGFPLEAPRFVYRRSEQTVPVFRMADATLTAGLGVGVRFSP